MRWALFAMISGLDFTLKAKRQKIVQEILSCGHGDVLRSQESWFHGWLGNNWRLNRWIIANWWYSLCVQSGQTWSAVFKTLLLSSTLGYNYKPSITCQHSTQKFQRFAVSHIFHRCHLRLLFGNHQNYVWKVLCPEGTNIKLRFVCTKIIFNELNRFNGV